MIRRIFATSMLAFVLSGSAPASADIVFLDYTNFQARLNQLTTTAGVTAFNTAEIAAIQAGIKSGLESSYNSFTGLSFSESNPGGTFATINFGLTAGSGSLGVADHIDFLNLDRSDTARVFTANFAFIINEFSGSTNRSSQLTQLTTALAGTAAHELGHNLGLRHHDSHGDLTYSGTPINTNGDEDTHIMATGSTGLTESGRETARDFSMNSIVKLEYAAGTLAVNPEHILEGADAGGTVGSARDVDLESLPVSGRLGEVVTGTIGFNGDEDLYRIDGSFVGDTLTADINIDYATGESFNNVDTVLTVYASDGTTVLGTVDNTFYSTTMFGSGTDRDFDGVLYNIATTAGEDVYVRVDGSGSDTGDYRLLIHTNGTSVPEPGSVAFLCGLSAFAFGSVLRRRRQRRDGSV